MAFDSIRQTLFHLRSLPEIESKAVYSITTNGSLFNHEILKILNEFNFTVVLSFDGFAQDISRQPGSFDHMLRLIRKIHDFDRIVLRTHSVFTPETVDTISESMKLIYDLGIESAGFNLSYGLPWTDRALDRFRSEMEKVALFYAGIYRQSSSIPISIFHKSQRLGITSCFGGQHNICLAPDESLWGCILTYDFAKASGDQSVAKKYSFGKLDHFIEHYESIYPEIVFNYSQIGLDKCRSRMRPCIECLDFLECTICPLAAAFGSHRIGVIPDWVCAIRQIIQKGNETFWGKIETAV